MYSIFCQNCKAYLLPSRTECGDCGWKRPKSTTPSEMGWNAPNIFGGPARGTPVFINDLVVFSWSDRRTSGGVTAINQVDGSLQWSTLDWSLDMQQIEQGVTRIGQKIVWGTRGRLPHNDGCLYAASSNGELETRIELPGGIWTPPIQKDQSVIVVTSDGSLIEFCSESFKIKRKYFLGESGWFRLVPIKNSLFIFKDQSATVWYWENHDRPPQQVFVGQLSKIITDPIAGRDAIFVSTIKGLFSISLSSKKIREVPVGIAPLTKPPLFANSILHYVTNESRLIRINPNDPEKTLILIKKALKKSFVGVPIFGGGLIGSVSRDGVLYLFRGDSGEFFGNIQMPVSRPAHRAEQAALGWRNNHWYFGDWEGNAYAIPWHLTQYEKAAHWLENRGLFTEAGSLYALAGNQTTLQEQARLNEKAIQVWLRGEHPEWAAYLQENNIAALPAKVAEVYQQAGIYLQHRKPALAFELLLSAADWYEEAGNDGKVNHCRRMVNRLARGPYLHIKAVTVPQIWQEENCFSVIIEIVNHGQEIARQVRIRFAGDLKTRVWVDVEHMETRSCVEVEAPLMANSEGELLVEAHYENKKGDQFQTQQRFEIKEVKPFEGVQIEGSVGWLSLEDISKRVKVRGDVGLLKSKDKVPVSAEEVPGIKWSDHLPKWVVEDRVLMHKKSLSEKQTIIPVGYKALFLSDETTIAMVDAGHYYRKDFRGLRYKLKERHQPDWKAVIFNTAHFRLSYKMGPYRTLEGVQVWVACGITVVIDENSFEKNWNNILGEKELLTTNILSRWLQGEISGTMKKWLEEQTEETISTSFSHREQVMLSLQEELRQTHANYGIVLRDPIWWLDFIIPGREKIDLLREKVYWETKTEYTPPLERICSHCKFTNLFDAVYCDKCGAEF